MTDYNWKENAQNLAQDWFFESYPETSGTPGLEADTFVQTSKSGGALPMLTIPLIGMVAHLGPNRTILPSFSVAKYGPQCAVDQLDPDAGDSGLKPKLQERRSPPTIPTTPMSPTAPPGSRSGSRI